MAEVGSRKLKFRHRLAVLEAQGQQRLTIRQQRRKPLGGKDRTRNFLSANMREGLVSRKRDPITTYDGPRTAIN